ncbi:hypothetical protein RB595_002528 [Gaeumannomyces hyphopodioides]
MSEAMQIRISRGSRVERTTTSCSECRRRKQRCNQAQPCSNCARRFPQPPCEYTASAHRRPAGSDPQPAFTLSTIPAGFGEDGSLERPGVQQQPLLQIGQVASEWIDIDPAAAQSWRERMCSGFDAGELVRWTGIDILTQFPGPSTYEALPWMTSPGQPGPGPANILCSSKCEIHPQLAKATAAMMNVRSPVIDRFMGGNWNPGRTEEIVSWLMTLDTSARLGAPSSRPPGDIVNQDMSLVPVLATKQNADLLRICECRFSSHSPAGRVTNVFQHSSRAIVIGLISRFKTALDGNPDPQKNQYVKFYVPFAIQTPLLAQVAIYTASCFLHETGHMDKTTTISHKGQAIRMLNELLRSSQSSTSDEAITAVIQLILDEWYWGETSDLRAHLRGLREMIRLRGGIRCLGMNGLVGKLAIVADVAIALSSEVAPFLRKGDEFEYREAGAGGHVPFRVAYNTPLVSPLVPFADCADALAIDPVTASTLDDMRFLISRVLGMPPDPSAAELRKLGKLAAWMLERMSKLPVYASRDDHDDDDGDHGDGPGPGPGDGVGDWAALSSYGSSPVSEDGGGVARARTPATVKHESPEVDDAGSFGSPETALGPQGATESTTVEAPDYMYEAVRQAALLYCRAVASRRPFSAVVGGRDLARLWAAAWRVSLTRWRGALGVFGWIVLPLVSSARGSPHDRLIKSMLNIWGIQMSLDNWEIAGRALRSALRLQEWLGGSAAAADGSGGGEGGGGGGGCGGGVAAPSEGGLSAVAEGKRRASSDDAIGGQVAEGLSPGAGTRGGGRKDGRAISPW